MGTRREITERSHKRYKSKEGALAVLNCAIPFHLIDISKNGLAFRYVGIEKWFDDPVELDIVYDDFCLKNLMVHSVSDLQVSNGVIQTRRHSVSFSQLTPSQKVQLEQFIERFTKEGTEATN